MPEIVDGILITNLYSPCSESIGSWYEIRSQWTMHVIFGWELKDHLLIYVILLRVGVPYLELEFRAPFLCVRVFTHSSQ